MLPSWPTNLRTPAVKQGVTNGETSIESDTCLWRNAGCIDSGVTLGETRQFQHSSSSEVERSPLMVKDQNAGIWDGPLVRIQPGILLLSDPDG